MTDFQSGFAWGAAVAASVMAILGIVASAYIGHSMRRGSEGPVWHAEHEGRLW